VLWLSTRSVLSISKGREKLLNSEYAVVAPSSSDRVVADES
jgi:hypothetical protein